MEQREPLPPVGDSPAESGWNADSASPSIDAHTTAPPVDEVQPDAIPQADSQGVIVSDAAPETETDVWSGGDPGTPADAQQDAAEAFPLRRKLLVAALLSPLLLAMLFSTISQVGFAWWLIERVPPPQRGGIEDLLNSHLVQIMLEQQELEQELEPPVEEEEPEAEVNEMLPPEPEVAPEPEPEPIPEPEPEQEPEPEPEPTPPPMDEAPAGPPGDGGGPGFATAPGGTGPGIAPGSGGGSGRGNGRGEGAPRAERTEERREESRDRREDRGRDEESARRVVRLEDTSEPPEVLRREPQLGYPREFREAGITGTVVLECIITDAGRVRACRRRSGPEELAEYATEIVQQWRFRPAMDHDGNPVVSTYRFNLPFRLN